MFGVTTVAGAIVVVFLCAAAFRNVRWFWFGLKKGLKEHDERVVVRQRRRAKRR
jgi:hypothetical protein